MGRARPSVCLWTAVSVWLAASGAQAQETDTALPSVTVATVEEHLILEVVPVSGTVRPREEVYVTPQLNGVQIRQVLVDVGDWVNAGDTLVRLKPDLFEAEVRQARAQVARAESSTSQARNQISSAEASMTQADTELDRVQRLLDRGSTTQSAYDQALERAEAARASAASARDGLASAEAEKDQAESQLEVAELNLNWTDITAPTTGVVGAREVKVGALTAPGSPPLITIFEGGTLELSAEVIETALGSVEAGDGGSVEVAGLAPLVGLVRSVIPTVDATTRLGEIRISLQNDGDLRAGLFGRGEIETERRMALAVPITAVLSDRDGQYVQVIEGDEVRRRAVVTGLIWQGMEEIVDGLSAGEVVVARAGAFFRDGDQVRPVEAGAGSEE